MALYDRGTPEGKASSALTLEADGKVNILTGVPDVGPGYYTVSQQMVCETLGVPPEKVGVVSKTPIACLSIPARAAANRRILPVTRSQSAHEVREKLVNLAARDWAVYRRRFNSKAAS